jgi:hypothetical protein
MSELGSTDSLGVRLVHFWDGLAGIAKYAFPIAYFYAASTAIYLLLRRDTDATDLDEVALDQRQPARELPPLAPDAQGIPGEAP